MLDLSSKLTPKGENNAENDCNNCEGNTVVQGSFTVGNGSVIVENLSIK